MTSSATAPARPGSGAGSPRGRRGRAASGLGALLDRTFWLWPALLTLAATVYRSGRPELWRDELATWSAATRSTGELLDMLEHVDAVSGAYYLFMHGWISLFGDSPVVLRLPSALAMTGAAVFTALTARKLFDSRVGLLAGVLLALFPSVSRYGQEVRSYAFVVLAASAATWLLLHAAERSTLLRWLPYSVAVAAAGLLHMVSLVFLAGHAAVVLLRRRDGRGRRLLPAFAVAVLVGLLPVVPLVAVGQRQVGRQISWLHTPDIHAIGDHWQGLFGSVLVGLCVLALAAVPAGWARGRRPALEIGLIAALPIVLTWIVSQGHASYFLDRYQLYTVTAWAVLAAAGLASLRPSFLTPVVLLAVAVLARPDLQHVRTTTAHETTNGRAAASVIAAGYRPGDGFAPLRGNQSYMMLDYEVDYYLPGSVHLKDVLAAKSAVARNDLFALPCAQPAACLAGTSRIWVVTTGGDADPLKEFPVAEAAALRSAYTPTEIKHVRGLTVALLERHAG
ncbi:glycosyltransferase family 39 protein [Kitasatospora sp. NPDC059571]|uniref:glycosyltransferase family 39 protein n=1 Tax=Kitasatospora sp. NPDC059571 TaxID=3346871 RepID=UPI0036CE5A9C